MEEILKQMIEQLQSLSWGEAQENVDGALAYLGCAVQNLATQQKMHPTELDSAKKSDSLVIGG